jgi:S1-C subfamily serine protease
VLGVRFEDSNDGMKVAEVVPRGPSDKAGLEPGDVIVGLGEIDTRDENSFMPLLAQHKAGDTVVLKVRRGEQYLRVPITLVRRTELPRPPAPPPATRPAPSRR